MRLFFILLIMIVLPQFGRAQKLEVKSPNDVIQVDFTLENGAPHYQVSRKGQDIILPSPLGFVLRHSTPLAWDFKVASSEAKSFQQTWEQPWGEKKEIENRYNELRIQLIENSSPSRKMTVVFRVYDDGVGFRYEIPRQPEFAEFEIMDELTEFRLAGDHQAWWIGAYQWNRYEYLYQNTPVSKIGFVHTPLTMKTKEGLYLSIHEAALTDFASMTLVRKGEYGLKADLVPWSDGVRVKATAIT